MGAALTIADSSAYMTQDGCLIEWYAEVCLPCDRSGADLAYVA